MDDNCGEWVESMGVASGCVCKDILYRFPHISYPTPLVSALFAAASQLFVHFLKCFSFLFRYFFVIYVKKNSRSINTNGDYGRPTAAI